MAINKKLFTQADLNGTNQLVYTHNLNNQDLTPALFDNTSRQLNTGDMFAYGDASQNNKDNIVTLDLGGVITGEWKLLLTYESAGESGSGRRAFELSENNSPEDAFRLIIGKEDTPSVNITLSNFFTLLMSKLGFLKVSQNLNDVNDKATSRSNLGVPSISDMNTALATKATLYQTGSGAAIGTSNTAIYSPTLSYHPATKKYVDDKILLAGQVDSAGTWTTKLAGTLTGSSAKLGGAGLYRVTHNNGSTSYMVAANTNDSSSGNCKVGAIIRSTNSFDIYLSDDVTGNDNDFEFLMYKI